MTRFIDVPAMTELMPVSDAQRYAFKYVNGHPANTAKGLYTVLLSELVPEASNPKDLFSHTRRQAGRARMRRVA